MNHREWVQAQFNGNGWKDDRYRNALIHSSLLESAIKNTSKENGFDKALKLLLCCNRLSSEEFCEFDNIRRLRNELIHDIFAKKLNEAQINERVKNLMLSIKEVYKSSAFLSKNILKPYEIKLQK